MTQTAHPLTVRQAVPDLLKVLAILAVVYIHGASLISYTDTGVLMPEGSMQLASRALRFCVPVFIFLWAYFMEKSLIKRGNESVMPKFYKLLIPYLFWSVIYFLLLADFSHLSLSGIFTKHFSGYGWSGQYYFIILFQLVLLFPFISRFSRTLSRFVPWVYILSILFYIILSYTGWFYISNIGKIGDRLFIYWIPYVILGVIYAHKNIFKAHVPIFGGILLLVLIPAETYWLHPQDVTLYLIPSIFICTLLLASSMEHQISYASLPQLMAAPVSLMAKHTLGIFCLNPLVFISLLPLFQKMGWNIHFAGASVLVPLASTFVITGICLALISLLKMLKLGFLVAN